MAIDISGKKIITTVHAYQKMMERSILKEDAVICIKEGTIIRIYGDSKPFPAYLVSHVCKKEQYMSTMPLMKQKIRL